MGGRNHYIDQLRGLSILAVMISHSELVGVSFPIAIAATLYVRLEQAGYYGVAVFFVISGFLITSNVIGRSRKLGNIAPSQFYAMRVSRIFPCLLLLLTLLSILNFVGVAGFKIPPGTSQFNAWIAALTFRYNFFYFHNNVPGMSAWSVLWSLSIEEQFYLVFPIFCLLLRRDAFIVAALVLCVLAGPYFRLEYLSLYKLGGAADLLAMGALAALLVNSTTRFDRPTSQALRLVGLLIMFLVCLHSHVNYNYVFGPSIIGLGAAAFLIGSGSPRANTGPVKNWNWPALLLQLMGRSSYELYLYGNHPFGTPLSAVGCSYQYLREGRPFYALRGSILRCR
jgi:peptidoglycan/LPS O-acetylase OafA/YrhL